MTISSPGPRCLPPQAYATRLIASVVPRTKMISSLRLGADESADRVAGLFVGVGRARRKLMRGAVDVRVLVRIEVGQPVDDRLRLLRGGGVVEPDQRLAVDGLAQDREVGTDRVDIEDLVIIRCDRDRFFSQVGGGRRGQEVVVGFVALGAPGVSVQPRSPIVGVPGNQPGTDPRGATGTVGADPASTPGTVGTIPDVGTAYGSSTLSTV